MNNTIADTMGQKGGSNNGSKIYLNSNIVDSYDNLSARFASQQPSVDVIWQEYYDTTTLATATALNYSFFRAPNTGGNALSNLAGSNGRLAGDQAMVVKAIKFEYYVPTAAVPVNLVELKNLYSQTYLQFWVMNKPYWDNNALCFVDPEASQVVSTTFHASQPFKPVNLPIEIIIAKNTSFYITATAPAVTLAATISIKCSICGVLFRGVQ